MIDRGYLLYWEMLSAGCKATPWRQLHWAMFSGEPSTLSLCIMGNTADMSRYGKRRKSIRHVAPVARHSPLPSRPHDRSRPPPNPWMDASAAAPCRL